MAEPPVAFTKNTAARIIKATRRVEQMSVGAFQQRRRYPISVSEDVVDFFEVRLGLFTPINANRWSYLFTEVTPQLTGLYADQADPRAGICYNRVEAYNASTGMLGIGITVEDLVATGKTLLPLGPGVYTCYQLKDCNGGTIYEVEHQNAVQVKCE